MKENHFLLVFLYSNVNLHMSDKLIKPLRIVPYKIFDRLFDVTYELLAQDGSTLHVQRNHSIPHYPKEPFLYPHLRHFMRFSDSINYDNNILKPIKYANSDSSPFNSNGSLSDDPSSSDDQNPSQNDLFQNSSNTNPPSNITSTFKQILKAPENNQFSDRTRHPSQNQSTPPYTTDNRNTKTRYNLKIKQPLLRLKSF